MLTLSIDNFKHHNAQDSVNIKIMEAKLYNIKLEKENKQLLFSVLSGLKNEYNGNIKFNDIFGKFICGVSLLTTLKNCPKKIYQKHFPEK